MKNDDNYYETLLKEFGFKYNLDKDAWFRGVWVIRFWDNQIEMYEDVDDRVGKYLLSDVDKIDLQSILEDIEGVHIDSGQLC